MLSTNDVESSQNNLLKLIAGIVVGLGLLVPLSTARRNIDLQGMLLLLGGFYAIAYVAMRRDCRLRKIDQALLVGLIASSLLSVFFAHDTSTALLGGLRYRVGMLSLVSAAAIGLALSSKTKFQKIQLLYITSVALALVAIPYNFYFLGSGVRLFGTLYQPDILAAILGCGFLFGLHLLHREPSTKYLWVAQTILLIDLVMTESRAVLVLVFLLSLVYMLKDLRNWRLLGIFGVVLVGFVAIGPIRVTSTSYFGQSISYRSHLAAFVVQKIADRPLGYGAGNLLKAIDCRDITSPDLVKTCRQGLGFDSSHNWFIDRFLEYGWVGGICFLLLTVRAMFSGRKLNAELQILKLAFLLLVFYSMTNVSGIEIEVFFWIILASLITDNSAINQVGVGRATHKLKYSHGKKTTVGSKLSPPEKGSPMEKFNRAVQKVLSVPKNDLKKK